jgi:glycosyltransferase involved in cell wall biosynthesis
VLGERLSHRLSPAGDPVALASFWRSALLDEEARTKDGAAARARVSDHFSLDAMIRAYERLYDPSP